MGKRHISDDVLHTLAAGPPRHHDSEQCQACLIRHVAGKGPCVEGQAVLHYFKLLKQVPELACELLVLRGH